MTATISRAAIGLGMLLLAGCSGAGAEAPTTAEIEAAVHSAEIPARFSAGEEAFNANCVTCHGERALGTEQGPPLVHIFYEPNHHADIAFQIAVERGVRAHHWSFGDMPPVAGVSADQIEAITDYIRFLQREAGIY